MFCWLFAAVCNFPIYFWFRIAFHSRFLPWANRNCIFIHLRVFLNVICVMELHPSWTLTVFLRCAVCDLGQRFIQCYCCCCCCFVCSISSHLMCDNYLIAIEATKMEKLQRLTIDFWFEYVQTLNGKVLMHLWVVVFGFLRKWV